jgi:hypothetical protein
MNGENCRNYEEVEMPGLTADHQNRLIFFIKLPNRNCESKIEFHSRILIQALNGSENKLNSQHHKFDLQTATTFYCSHILLGIAFNVLVSEFATMQ